MGQLSKYSEDIRKIVRQIELQLQELDLLILKTPTGPVREELTNANIYILQGIQHLKEVA